MNQRVSLILLVAFIVSGAATYLAYRTVTARNSRGPAVQTVQVVQAARNLETGTIIRESDLKLGPWVGAAPAGMATNKKALIDRGVIAPIYEGESIMESRVAAAGAGGGMASTIPSGMRAVAVRVNDIAGVAGFVVPGMRVDVLISGVSPTSATTGARVKTLLQNVEVLSSGQNYQKDAEGKPVVTQVVNLLVTPEQAEVLSLANNETRLQLVLRNPLDKETAKTPGAALAGIFGGERPPEAARPKVVPVFAKPAPEPPRVISLPPYQIEIFNGAQRTEAKFARKLEEKQ